MLRLFLRNRNVSRKRRTKIMLLLSIRDSRTSRNLRSNKKLKGSEKKKKGRFSDLENCRRKLPIVKLRLMP